MRTFAQKQNSTQKSKTTGSARPSRTLSGQSRDSNSIPNLQRMIRNQAVQRLLQPRIEQHQFDSEPDTVLTSHVNKAIGAPGQPLGPDTRPFMEQGFGHDFSKVRIHSDSEAAQSAAALNARAYTLGSNIVFGSGQFAPQSRSGQRLLAHELMHVAQQTHGLGEYSRKLMRAPRETRRQSRHDERLKKLAIWPGDALTEWKRLRKNEQQTILEGMTKKYGSVFVRLFQEYASGTLKPNIVMDVRIAKQWPNLTPKWFAKRGYHYAGRTPVAGGRITYWVHPSGRQIRLVTIPWSTSQATAKEPQPVQERQPEQGENPPRIDPSVDAEKVYGQEITSRQDAVILGQKGYAIQYGDGTIELFLEGTTAHFTYRPRPDSLGAYDFYDEKGEKAEGVVISIDPSTVFGHGTQSEKSD